MTVDPRYPALAAGITAFVVGAIFVGDPVPTDLATLDAPVYATGTPVPARETVRPVTLPLTANTSGAAPLDVPVSLAAPLVTRGAPVTDGPPPAPPVPAAGDCGAWADVFRHYGATETEIAWFVPVLQRETECGRDFINDDTSDRYVCQLNGVHAEPGYSYGTYYGEGGWMLELFGLRGGRAVTTQAEASTVLAVPACLWLLRGGTTPDTFAGAHHWNT